MLSLTFCFIILVWGPLVIQLKYCPLLPSLNKVDYYYYYYSELKSQYVENNEYEQNRYE